MHISSEMIARSKEMSESFRVVFEHEKFLVGAAIGGSSQLKLYWTGSANE